MLQEMETINLPLPYKMGSVNCYLVKTKTGHFLIDTGCSKQRSLMKSQLESAGCTPDNLKLIVLTHGDFDHAGNCAYLREKYGARIAMHHDDSGMVEHGNMFWNRKKGNILIRTIASLLFGFGKAQRFEPDLRIDDGYDLSSYGFDARVLHIPGHSRGSIGILTANGDLICGDLLENRDKPGLNSIMDDKVAASASVEKLKGLRIHTVYPGHGKPFPIDSFIQNHR